MAMIRQKKKNLILSMILGMIVTSIPLGIYGGTMTYKKTDAEKKAQALEAQMAGEKEYTAYCLKESGHKGDLLDEDALVPVVVKTESDFFVPDKSDLLGKHLSAETKAGIMITDSMVYEAGAQTGSIRTYLYDYIVLPEGITAQDQFDIRIRFPDGEDYIVATGKRVESMVDTGAFIHATEEENIMLSSAWADAAVYEGTKIYASLYTSDYQTDSVVNYPVNLYTTEQMSWNQNLTQSMDTETNRINRQMLEQNLFDFMGVMMGGETLPEA